MARPETDIDFAATVLAAQPAFSTDADLCRHYKISATTLWRYRKLLKRCKKLQQAVKERLVTIAPTWQEDLRGAMRKVISAIVVQVENTDGDPKYLDKTVNALQAMGELIVSNDVLFEDASSEEIEESVEDLIAV